VVSGSHIPAPVEALTSSTTNIRRHEIEAKQPASMVELLRLTPGLHIDQPGGRGGISSVYLRGADPNFALVLIDGIEVNDPTTTRGGSFDLSSVSVSDIERVEIVRGPLSMAYGPDALAGVINIITRRPTDKPTYTVEGAIGTEGYHQANVAARGPIIGNDKLGYALSANYVDDGGPVEAANSSARVLPLVSAASLSTPSPHCWQVDTQTRTARSFPSKAAGRCSPSCATSTGAMPRN
jgi:vitamin B12 transporter